MNELKTKSDEALIDDLKKMVIEERRMLTRILHYLKEVEERKLYLERGYPSLFAFMTEELHYSEGAAQRRIQTMRLMRDVPEVGGKIESGRLSLSVASQVQSFLHFEEKKREREQQEDLTRPEKINLINQLEGVSSRVCEKKLAEISPEAKIPRERARPISEEKVVPRQFYFYRLSRYKCL